MTILSEIKGTIVSSVNGRKREISCTRSLSHSGYIAHGNSKGETRKSDIRKIARVKNLERNGGAKKVLIYPIVLNLKLQRVSSLSPCDRSDKNN